MLEHRAFSTQDEQWMRQALVAAREAMEAGELPIATVLVAGGKELSRSSTLTHSQNSIVAHGEVFALLEAHERVFTAERPLVIYTTLEPCLMCVGAAMQSTVDRIVFGMDAVPDGGARFVEGLHGHGQSVPMVQGGLLRDEALALMRQFVETSPEHPGHPYARQLVE